MSVGSIPAWKGARPPSGRSVCISYEAFQQRSLPSGHFVSSLAAAHPRPRWTVMNKLYGHGRRTYNLLGLVQLISDLFQRRFPLFCLGQLYPRNMEDLEAEHTRSVRTSLEHLDVPFQLCLETRNERLEVFIIVLKQRSGSLAQRWSAFRHMRARELTLVSCPFCSCPLLVVAGMSKVRSNGECI